MIATAHEIERCDTTLYAIRDAITELHIAAHPIAAMLVDATLAGRVCIDSLGDRSWEVIGNLHTDLFPTVDDIERESLSDGNPEVCTACFEAATIHCEGCGGCPCDHDQPC